MRTSFGSKRTRNAPKLGSAAPKPPLAVHVSARQPQPTVTNYSPLLVHLLAAPAYSLYSTTVVSDVKGTTTAQVRDGINEAEWG